MSTAKGPGQAWWESHLNAIDSEGIDAKTYAQREGLAVSNLYYWRRRIKAQIHGPLQAAPRSTVALIAPPSHRFVPVTLATNNERTIDRHVLILGSGLRLELSSLPTPQWLAQVSQAMAAQER